MRTRQISSLSVLLCGAGLAVSVGVHRVSAQTGCPTPTSTGWQWPQNQTVYYDDSGLNSTEQGAVVTAFNEWNTANGSNGSGVSFFPADAAHLTTLVLTNNATAPTPSGSACSAFSSGAAAKTCATTSGTTLVSATVSYNLSGTIPNTNPPQPMYDQSDSTGFSQAIQEYTLHEVGHTMGEGDQPAGTTNTVMNQGCGTNDSGNCIPTNVTTCDKTQVSKEPAYPPPPPPSNSCNSDSDCPTSYTCGKGTCVYNPTGSSGGMVTFNARLSC